MTYPAGTRVRRRGRTGTAHHIVGLAHRTLVTWDDQPGWVQFVDDELLQVVTTEQETLL